MVEAIERGDETSALDLCGPLLEILTRPWELEVACYSREGLGGFYRDFAGILFDDAYGEQPITEPPEAVWERAKGQFEAARALVRTAAPAAHREMEAFWSRIYVGVANPDSTRARFGGVTSLVLWGGTFANAEQYDSEIKAAEFMVHEVTHALLFAVACDEPLVLNPADELFHSPLRSDPRPMDGIYHAALVCARITEFYSDLRAHAAALGVDDDSLVRKRDANAEKFQRGCATVRESGVISPLAGELLEQAAARVQMLRSEG
jgi:HEXXH motif-containing protein